MRGKASISCASQWIENEKKNHSRKILPLAIAGMFGFMTLTLESCQPDSSPSNVRTIGDDSSKSEASRDSAASSENIPLPDETDDSESEDQSLDLAGPLLVAPSGLGEFAVAISTSEKVCSGIFITPKKILTAASCLISDSYNWGKMVPIYFSIEKIIRSPGLANELLYNRAETPDIAPEIFANPSFLSIYRVANAPQPDASQHLVAKDNSGLKFFKEISDAAVIDLSRTGRGMNESLFANSAAIIKPVTDPARVNKIISSLSTTYSTSTSRSLLILGSGKRPNNDPLIKANIIRLPRPANAGGSYLNYSDLNGEFALSYAFGSSLRSYPCEGDDGAPLMYQTSQSGKLVFEIIAVTNLKRQDGCLGPDGSKFKFTRLDSQVTAGWIRKQVSCTTDCGTDDYKSAYLSTHSTFIKGNPIFVRSDQAIDSSSLQTRLLMQRDGNLVAYCKKDGRVAWASGTNAPNGRILTIGVWNNPTPRIIFSPIRRNAQYFRNQGTGIDFVGDYFYRSQRWPKERLPDEDLAGFGSFPIPNNNPNGSAILSLQDDGMELSWTTDTVGAVVPPDRILLKKISWASCTSAPPSAPPPPPPPPGGGTDCRKVVAIAREAGQCSNACASIRGKWTGIYSSLRCSCLVCR
jgi:hypothetical protein